MTLTELKQVLPLLLTNKLRPFLWGSQGIGKTQAVKQYAKEQGIGFVHIHAATQEVGDLVGLLKHNSDGSVSHSRPSWMPSEGRGVVFLDELNRATPDVLQALFSFVQDGTIHTHKLGGQWSIVAAGNYNSSSFNTTDMVDAAWTSRFVHIDVRPSIEEFVDYAEDCGRFNVANFASQHPELLSASKESFDFSELKPDRRALLEKCGVLDDAILPETLRYELYSGCIGSAAAAAYIACLKKSTERISGKQVVKSYKSVKNKVVKASSSLDNIRMDVLNSALEEVILTLNKENVSQDEWQNVAAFLLDIPLELGLKAVKTLSKNTEAKRFILNNSEFVDTFNKRRLS
jgi:hypothetical protein